MIEINKWISAHPRASIVVVLAITAIMIFSIYANGVSTQLNEESFMPDMEVVNAWRDATSNYTEQYTIQILFRSNDGDILNEENLKEIFEVEEALIQNATVVANMKEPVYPEGNILSLPTTLAVTRIVAEAKIQGIDDEFLLYYPYNITQMKKALLGKNITIHGENKTINLQFKYTPSNVKESIKLLYFDPEGKAALEYISRTLTKDFNVSSSNIKAEGCLIILSLNPEIKNPLEIEKTTDAMVKSVDAQHVKTTTIGGRLIADEIINASDKSMEMLIPLAILMIIIVLLIVYRNLMDTILSLIVLAFSIIWMYGFGAAFHFEFNPMTTAIPIMLMGLGIDYGIHLTMRYREENGESGRDRANKTLETVGAALFLATLTTMVAFLSNLVSPIELLQQFGTLSAFGTFASFIAMILFVPSVQQLRNKKTEEKKEGNIIRNGKEFVNKVAGVGATAGNRHPFIVISIAIAVTLLSGVASLNLNTTFDIDEFLPENLEVTQDLHYMTENFEFMGGEAQSVYILVKGDVCNPSFYKALNRTVKNISDDESVVKIDGTPEVQSIATVMHDYAIMPGNSTFSSLYFTYFNNSGILKENVTKENITMLYDCLYANNEKLAKTALNKNESYDATLIQISTNTGGDRKKIMKLYAELKEDAEPFDQFKVSVTGDEIVTVMVEDTLNKGQTNSLILTILTSFIILMIIFYLRDRSITLGIITAIPVIFCVAWILGAMYLMGMALNVMTISIASLTVGLGVTYGIHISHRFVEELKKGSIEEAAHKTVNSTGISLFGAATTTIAGFGLLSFSLMPPLQEFGRITAMTIFFAFISSVFILPSFLILWARRKYGGN